MAAIDSWHEPLEIAHTLIFCTSFNLISILLIFFGQLAANFFCSCSVSSPMWSLCCFYGKNVWNPEKSRNRTLFTLLLINFHNVYLYRSFERCSLFWNSWRMVHEKDLLKQSKVLNPKPCLKNRNMLTQEQIVKQWCESMMLVKRRARKWGYCLSQ